ncbi:hypothetical protein H7I91_16305, partial [Mycobacterium bouchedurhonense]|nr:hypothetical protein [Mycobacterium bouchedurhonense]
GHFATDITHAAELRDQHTKTAALIELRRQQYRQRTGRELTDSRKLDQASGWKSRPGKHRSAG